MNAWITAFLMAFSMFTAIPCPYPKWDEAQRGKMLLCLPLVGLLLGGLFALFAFLLQEIGCPRFLSAALLTLFPFLLTGFLHLDGFMDCADAILSRRDLPTRQKILKDSHVGSFAVISLCALFLLTFALFADADLHGRLWALVFLPAVTRACSSAAVLLLPSMNTSSYHEMKRTGAAVPISFLVLFCALPILLCGLPGFSCLAAALGSALAIFYGVRQLGGMSGDISGFAITLGELCGLAVLILI